jgi:hypothetical protein
MFRKRHLGSGGMQQVIRIAAMHNLNVVSLVSQGVGEAINVHGVAPETVRGIKGGHMEDVHGFED